ncbi:MAG: RagB/SusD family nutrient uptake outer membrane protein [Prolixibacteraceae bacterium]|nr:RagB/SusD family nutrient uptake outer membrane protein [Prolixibacteraceae bacterium]
MKIFKNIFPAIVIVVLMFSSCKDYFYSPQVLVIEEREGFKDWIDYRSAVLGLYSLQQKLVEQLIVLGELRGDLLKTTTTADPDLIDIQNFEISSTNKYAQANNFYHLIASCNALIRTLELYHPEVMDKNPIPNDYHRIYGEALCMRGWAYFNAVRIYGKVPYIPEQLTNYRDIIDFIMNPGSTFYVDSSRYAYDISGLNLVDVNDTVFYPVDTVYVDTVHYETYPRRFVDMQTVVDNVTYDLTKRLKYVGVQHGQKDGLKDDTWKAIVWTDSSRDYLLGQMAMQVGNINGAYGYFYSILFNYENIQSGSTAIRFGLDGSFANNAWKSIHTGININEHIYTIWFGKTQQQTHELQRLFDNTPGNLYYMQPTTKAVHLWETEWRGQEPDPNNLWDNMNKKVLELDSLGRPGDFYRGYSNSYVYKYGTRLLTQTEVEKMLKYKSLNQEIDQQNLMRGVDTIVYKFTMGKSNFLNDSHVILYRAASVHLYAAEIYTYSHYLSDGKEISRATGAPRFLDGKYRGISATTQLGVRGRVNLYTPEIDRTVIVLQDPFTNKITGTRDFSKESGNNNSETLRLQKEYYEEVLLNERAKELAFEGERFYDIMRIAQRRNDPSFLANLITDAQGKYKSNLKQKIRTKLMNPKNWYIPFYITYGE